MLRSGSGKDTFLGGAGNDSLYGGRGGDLLVGAAAAASSTAVQGTTGSFSGRRSTRRHDFLVI
jgi:Ca2+-binding RTX toxin-like protein